MIHEIQARTILSRVRGFDTWFGFDYGMNLYRGCQHHCIYCDSRSACYGNDRFDEDVAVKTNAVAVLRNELARRRSRGIVGTGSMNDPYMPLEAETRLTAGALDALADYRFGVHVVTKSTLVVRDIPRLRRVARSSPAAVSLSITTADDRLGRIVEPGAPPPSERFHALRELAAAGVETRIALMPLLPFLEDSLGNLDEIVERAAACGVRTVVAAFGVTLRDRQRAYFYERLDESFPGVRAVYEASYGDRYVCLAPAADRLRARFLAHCASLGIQTSVSPFRSPAARQPRLFS
ncbi:MAG: radical SAM protein [Candidatus Bipolaricaulota bacterium]